jgi:hypothetical protein
LEERGRWLLIAYVERDGQRGGIQAARGRCLFEMAKRMSLVEDRDHFLQMARSCLEMAERAEVEDQ